MLPMSAISAGSVNIAAEGRSAITTPANPTSTAVQRRQPTFSLSSNAEKRRHVDRAREIERDRVGERQVADRPEEHRDFERSRADTRSTCKPGRGAPAKAARPARQISGMIRSSVVPLRISSSWPTE